MHLCAPEPLRLAPFASSSPGLPVHGGGNPRWLRRGLASAVACGGFVLHYQPRLCLARGHRVGVEALLRWPHRRQGLLPPSAFLAEAERGGHAEAIGAWVLRTACREATSWPGLRLSVNVSARQLQEGVLLDQVSAALDESGLPPDRLDLEFGEAATASFADDDLIGLSTLRDLGVGLVLDDLGATLASLTPLKRLPLTAVKLDRSLVAGLPHDAEDGAIARALVATAHALGLSVVAEGIETEVQRAFLAAIGCDEGQGFLFMHPSPATAIAALAPGG